MDANPTGSKPLTLEPLAGPTAGGNPVREAADGSPAGAQPQRELRITTADEFLAAAAKEYEKGHIDQALWARSAAQSGGDESLAIAAYLRARAIALQLHRREQRAPRPVRATGEPSAAGEPRVKPATRSESHSPESIGAGRAALKPKLLYGGGAAVLALLVGVWLTVSSWHSETAPAAAVAAASSAMPAPATGVRAVQAVAQPSVASNQAEADPTLETRVRELQQAGNWNVLVLYAVEWTRKEPDNAAAWNALSVGYANLRQHDEALDAASKAVRLAPADPAFLRTLGHANLALERLPEAAAAFDRALAVTADDADALCGAALVAQKRSRPNDADAIVRRMAAPKISCPGISVGESAAVAQHPGARKASVR